MLRIAAAFCAHYPCPAPTAMATPVCPRHKITQRPTDDHQQLTLMRPRRPCLVHNSSGRNHLTSSGLWNIQRTTAFFL